MELLIFSTFSLRSIDTNIKSETRKRISCIFFYVRCLKTQMLLLFLLLFIIIITAHVVFAVLLKIISEIRLHTCVLWVVHNSSSPSSSSSCRWRHSEEILCQVWGKIFPDLWEGAPENQHILFRYPLNWSKFMPLFWVYDLSNEPLAPVWRDSPIMTPTSSFNVQMWSYFLCTSRLTHP